MKLKVLAHIIAITCFLIGMVLIHVVMNDPSKIEYPLLFFEIYLCYNVMFDTGFVLLGCGFFIEFYMSFKPIEVKK